jgi:hypothetical protein
LSKLRPEGEIYGAHDTHRRLRIVELWRLPHEKYGERREHGSHATLDGEIAVRAMSGSCIITLQRSG